MPPKQPSRAQLNKIAYQSSTPSFLQKFQNKMKGIADDDDEEYDQDEFEYVNDGSGRPPIPRRPPIPKRPAPGSDDGRGNEDDEDEGDERPQVVVLKEGKHLSAREVENIKRAEKGLPPLPDADDAPPPPPNTDPTGASSSTTSKPSGSGLSFSSGGNTSAAAKKRKAMGHLEDLIKEGTDKLEKDKSKKSKTSSTSTKPKKSKKESKSLLSFGDDA